MRKEKVSSENYKENFEYLGVLRANRGLETISARPQHWTLPPTRSRRKQVIFFDIVWPCLALFGHVWPCLAMFGLAWPCLTLFDLGKLDDGLIYGSKGDERPRGFDRRLDPERIVGATDSSGELMFLIKVWIFTILLWVLVGAKIDDLSVEGEWWGRPCSRQRSQHSHSPDRHQGYLSISWSRSIAFLFWKCSLLQFYEERLTWHSSAQDNEDDDWISGVLRACWGKQYPMKEMFFFSISKLYGFVVKSLAVKHFPRIHNCLQLLSNLPTAKSTFFHLCIWNILWQVTYYEAQYSKTLGAFVIVKKTNYLFRNKSQRSHHYLCELVSLTLRYEGGDCLGR